MEKAWKKLGNNVSVGDGSRGMDGGGGGGDDCCGEEGCPLKIKTEDGMGVWESSLRR